MSERMPDTDRILKILSAVVDWMAADDSRALAPWKTPPDPPHPLLDTRAPNE